MTDIIDIRALVRPGFEAARFTGTKWDTAADKAAFANDLCRFIVRGAKPRGGVLSGGLAAAADDVCQRRDRGGARHSDPGAEVIPEGDAELAAGLA